MRISACAKINIGLRVNDKRQDGYHDIDSYFARITLADDIDLRITDADESSVCIKGSSGYLEDGRTDLMESAALMFSEITGRRFHLDISILKRIPSKAGLGGGSSDAAAVLCSLNKHYGMALAPAALSGLALQIGSDVPFFVSGYSVAHVSGRGERVEPADGLSAYSSLLVFMPEHGNQTGSAYAYLDSIRRCPSKLPSLGDLVSYDDFPNDFSLADGKLQNGLSSAFPGNFVSLSGSGAAVYMLIRRDDDYDALLRSARAYAASHSLGLYTAVLC